MNPTSIPIIDLRDVIPVLTRNFRMILAVVVMASVGAAVFTLQMKPLFTATAKILIESRETNIVDVESILSGISADSATVDSQLEIIRSEALASRVIENLGLIDDPEFNPTLAEESWVKSLSPSNLIGLFSSVRPQSDQEKDETARIATIGNLLSGLDVSRTPRTKIIVLSYTSTSPRKSRDIANEFVDMYLVDQLEAKYEAAERATAWLEGRLTDLREQVKTSEETAELYRAAHGLIDADGLTITEQQLREINSQLLLARAELDGTRAKHQRVLALLEQGNNFDAISEVLASEAIRNLRREQSDLVRKEVQLSARYGDRHPSIVEVKDERRDLERQIRAEVRRIIVGLENEVAVAETRVNSLENSLASTTITAGEREQDRVRLRELQREATSNRTLYENFLARFKETRQQESLQQADARVISRASLPLSKSWPQTTLLVTLTGSVALLFGVGIAFAREYLTDSFRTPADLDQHLELPLLGSIPLLKVRDLTSLEKTQLPPHEFLSHKPLSAYSEGFRELRAGLELSDVDDPPRTVLFTSSLPGEGKTTSAISLATSCARSGKSVVIVDADLRKPSVFRNVGASESEFDMIDLLLGKCSLHDALQRDTKDRFSMLGTMRMPANPADLLASTTMEDVLASLREEFDIVIVDSPPVLPVADTKPLSSKVDKVVFVVKWAETPRDAAQQSVAKLREFGADFAGALLTQVDRDADHKYSKSGYYYKRYGDYYTD